MQYDVQSSFTKNPSAALVITLQCFDIPQMHWLVNSKPVIMMHGQHLLLHNVQDYVYKIFSCTPVFSSRHIVVRVETTISSLKEPNSLKTLL